MDPISGVFVSGRISGSSWPPLGSLRDPGNAFLRFFRRRELISMRKLMLLLKTFPWSCPKKLACESHRDLDAQPQLQSVLGHLERVYGDGPGDESS